MMRRLFLAAALMAGGLVVLGATASTSAAAPTSVQGAFGAASTFEQVLGDLS